MGDEEGSEFVVRTVDPGEGQEDEEASRSVSIQ